MTRFLPTLDPGVARIFTLLVGVDRSPLEVEELTIVGSFPLFDIDEAIVASE
jgi:hypothetical protein